MTEQTFDEYLGPWWDEPKVINTLGVNAKQLTAWRNQLRLIGMKFNDNRYYYPARQFTKTTPVTIVHGLDEVLTILNTAIHDPDTWATWLAGEFDDEMSMWDALHLGCLDDVLQQASQDSASWRS